MSARRDFIALNGKCYRVVWWFYTDDGDAS
jgi:hypothetical protein